MLTVRCLGSRDWVLDHARNEIISTFNDLKTARRDAHVAYLQTLPCYTLYQKWHGAPPVQPAQLHALQQQIHAANMNYRAGIDEDWRRSCMRYPEVLDYYFSLVEVVMPGDRDPSILEPRFGAPVNGTRKVKTRRNSRGSVDMSNGHRKKDRRRGSRGRTPPAAPMASQYR